MLRAITPIRHDGTRYNPGDVLPDMSTKAETRLVECGAAEKIDVPSKPAAVAGTGKGKNIKPAKASDESDEDSSIQLPTGIDPNLAPEE